MLHEITGAALPERRLLLGGAGSDPENTKEMTWIYN